MDFFDTVINLEFLTVFSFLLCCTWMAISPCMLCCGFIKIDHDENIENIQNIEEEDEEEEDEDNIHDKISSYTNKMVILNWYDRNQMSYIVRHPITDTVWQKLLDNQDNMASACNELVEGWALSTIQDNLVKEKKEREREKEKEKEREREKDLRNTIDDTEEIEKNEEYAEDKLKNVLSSFSNNLLRLYAGISENNKHNKEELVEIILEMLRQNHRRAIEKRLERLGKMLE